MASEKSEIFKALGAAVCNGCGEVGPDDLRSGLYTYGLYCPECYRQQLLDYSAREAKRASTATVEQHRYSAVPDTGVWREAIDAEWGQWPLFVEHDEMPTNWFKDDDPFPVDTEAGPYWSFSPAPPDDG